MRPLFLIAITALALAACGKDRQADSGSNTGSGLTADNIVANDVTAIDAVTADAANMAADIDYTEALAELNDSSESNASAGNAARNSGPPARSAGPATRTPAPDETPPDPDTNAQ